MSKQIQIRKSTATNKIERGGQKYRDGLYKEALAFFTDAIGMVKTNSDKITLHSNRAACFLKLQDFKKVAEECTSVLELDSNHSGALLLRAQSLETLKEYHSALFDVNRLLELNPSSEVYQNLHARLKTQLVVEECTSVLELDSNHSGALLLRAQTLVTLKEYHSALFDVNRLLELNPSSEVYQNLHACLKTQLSLAPIPESEEEFEEHEDEKDKAMLEREEKKEEMRQKHAAASNVRKDLKGQLGKGVINIECAPKQTDPRFSSKLGSDQNYDTCRSTTEHIVPKAQNKESSEQQSKAWKTIPKPKGHSALDYARWDNVEDDSSEDEDEDDESLPQYRFRVKTIGVRPAK